MLIFAAPQTGALVTPLTETSNSYETSVNTSKHGVIPQDFNLQTLGCSKSSTHCLIRMFFYPLPSKLLWRRATCLRPNESSGSPKIGLNWPLCSGSGTVTSKDTITRLSVWKNLLSHTRTCIKSYSLDIISSSQNRLRELRCKYSNLQVFLRVPRYRNCSNFDQRYNHIRVSRQNTAQDTI